MSEQTPQDGFLGSALPDAEPHRMLKVVTPLWDESGCLCGRACICQQRREWKQIEQLARECEAPVVAIFGSQTDDPGPPIYRTAAPATAGAATAGP